MGSANGHLRLDPCPNVVLTVKKNMSIRGCPRGSNGFLYRCPGVNLWIKGPKAFKGPAVEYCGSSPHGPRRGASDQRPFTITQRKAPKPVVMEKGQSVGSGLSLPTKHDPELIFSRFSRLHWSLPTIEKKDQDRIVGRGGFD